VTKNSFVVHLEVNEMYHHLFQSISKWSVVQCPKNCLT